MISLGCLAVLLDRVSAHRLVAMARPTGASTLLGRPVWPCSTSCSNPQLPHPCSHRCSQANWSFYLGLSIFRLASILAGVGARAAQGNASSRIAAQARQGGFACRTCLFVSAARAVQILSYRGQSAAVFSSNRAWLPTEWRERLIAVVTAPPLFRWGQSQLCAAWRAAALKWWASCHPAALRLQAAAAAAACRAAATAVAPGAAGWPTVRR